MKSISLDFYLNEDVIFLAKNLLGKFLFTKKNNKITGGMIVETEAYRGINDKASHAYNNRRTRRNEVMYALGGVAYVYICYGIHNMFNVVTNVKDAPDAILIRALIPTHGIREMKKRLNITNLLSLNGPGLLTKALGITMNDNKKTLNSSSLWLEDRGIMLKSKNIITGPRIGVEYANEDALLPWRFRISCEIYSSLSISKKR